MGSISGVGSLTALLRWFKPHTFAVPMERVGQQPPERPKKRYYGPQRDAVFEQSAMAREMFRL